MNCLLSIVTIAFTACSRVISLFQATLWILNLEVALQCRKFGNFFIACNCSARRSRLQVFSDKVKDLGALAKLCDILPPLVYLKDFRLALVGRALIKGWLTRQRQVEWLSVLKRNGSLLKVEVFVRSTWLDLPPQVQLLLRRNDMMPRRRAYETENANRFVAEDVPPLFCYPKLFQQSLQCRMSPSWLLRGLVALGDSICTLTGSNHAQ